MTEESIEAISDISPVVLISAINLKNSLTKNKIDTIQRDFLPQLALACCIGSDTEPREEMQTLKDFTKFNNKCKEPLEDIKVAMLLEETRENLVYYLDKQEEMRREFSENKKQKAIEKRQEEIEKAQNKPIERDPEITKKAMEILTNGNPLEFLMDEFHKNHSGHDELARCIFYAFCVQSSRTSKGIQPETTGAKGSGKTHTVNSALHLEPPELIYDSTFSPKSLYYAPPKPGSTIYSDEDLDPDLVKLVKRMMSNFQRDTRHTTIIDKQVKTLVIPKRQVFLSSTVLGDGDDQFSDRTVQVGISNSKEDDEKYAEFESKRRQEGRPEFQVTENVLIAREMMRIIREHEFEVKMIEVKFSYENDRRLINIFYDLVEASAILNFMKRGGKVIDSEGITRITPTREDIEAALNFEMFRFTNEDVDTRLTKAQVSLHNTIQDYIRNKDKKTLTESEIVNLYGKSQQAVRKLLYGLDGSPNHITGGLLDRTRWYTTGQDPQTKENTIVCEKTITFSNVTKSSFAYTPIEA